MIILALGLGLIVRLGFWVQGVDEDNISGLIARLGLWVQGFGAGFRAYCLARVFTTTPGR